MREKSTQFRIQKDTDRDAVYVQAETQRTQAEFMSRREELAVRRELALIEYANRNQQTLEQIKGKLADTVLKLRTQKELALTGGKTGSKQVVTPAAEPPQHAPNGQAFTQ